MSRISAETRPARNEFYAIVKTDLDGKRTEEVGLPRASVLKLLRDWLIPLSKPSLLTTNSTPISGYLIEFNYRRDQAIQVGSDYPTEQPSFYFSNMKRAMRIIFVPSQGIKFQKNERSEWQPMPYQYSLDQISQVFDDEPPVVTEI